MINILPIKYMNDDVHLKYMNIKVIIMYNNYVDVNSPHHHRQLQSTNEMFWIELALFSLEGLHSPRTSNTDNISQNTL